MVIILFLLLKGQPDFDSMRAEFRQLYVRKSTVPVIGLIPVGRNFSAFQGWLLEQGMACSLIKPNQSQTPNQVTRPFCLVFGVFTCKWG